MSKTYWTDSSWTVYASSAKESLQFKQELPFALIGSGAHCHPRLPVQGDLKTAYLACNFEDRIEIWPLCAIAFPAWGILPPVVEVLLGQYRLRFEKYAKNPDQQAAWNPQNAETAVAAGTQPAGDVELTMAWDGKSMTKVIARSVTVLGSQHPSVWRTRGRHMRACDHAIVCEHGRVWLVDLNPLEKRLRNPAIHELQKNGEYYQVGDMRLSRGPATVECESSIQARRDRQPHLDCTPAGQQSRSKSTAPVDAHDGKQVAPSIARGALEARDTLERRECPEMLTSRLTGRLVSINQSRFTRGKMIRMGASAVTFVAASVFLFWLFQ